MLSTIQLPDNPITHIKHHPMNLDSPLLNPLNNIRILPQRLHPLLDIRLHQRQLLRLRTQPLRIPLLPTIRPQLPQRHQPRIQKSQLLIPHRRRAPTAGSMAANDHMGDFEVGDGIFDHGEGAEVRGGDDVGDVAVREDGTRGKVEDGGFGDARVGAAEPEDLGVLAGGHCFEEFGVLGGGLVGPCFVGFEGLGEGIWGWWDG